MTPYAILLVKPNDPDEFIRKTYHVFARESHPDFHPLKAIEWKRYTDAYTAIKTQEARDTLALKTSMLAGVCEDCNGSGVKGTRMFKGKIRYCETCKGEGRTR